jgi:hypothetical protein
MPWLALAIPAAISAGTSIAGMIQQAKANGAAQDDIDKAVQNFIAISVPDPEQQKIELQKYQSTGDLSPQLESAIKQDPSSYEKIVKNQQYGSAQDKALSQLQSLGENGGLSLSDKANIQSQTIANASKDKGNRDAITDEMARRGQSGSGLALQAQLSGAQSAGDRDAQMRLQTLGTAQDRALQSIQGAGSLATQLQGQDYQRQADLASANDKINQFNTTNAQNVQQRNAAANNAAATYNLDKSQNLSNANTQLSNQEQTYNKGLTQQNYEDQLQKAGAISNASTGQATNLEKNGATTASQYGAVGSAIGEGGAAVQDQNNWDTWLKATQGNNNDDEETT